MRARHRVCRRLDGRWAALHRAELRPAWELASRNQEPSKIAPLEQNKNMIRIISAEPLPQCRLKIAFNDGVSGVFPVKSERRGGVDLCPDTMHQAMTGAEAELHSPMALREEKEKM